MDKRNKPWFVLSLLGLIASFLSFAFDKQATFFFATLRHPFLTSLFFLFSYLPFLILLFLIFPSFILWKQKDKILLLFSIFVRSTVVVLLLKLLLGRARPYETFDITPLARETTSSMPSAHTLIIFSSIPFIFKNFKKTRWVFLAFAFLVALSRLYLGVHYLSDVAIGAFVGIIIGEVAVRIERKKKILKRLEKKVSTWLSKKR